MNIVLNETSQDPNNLTVLGNNLKAAMKTIMNWNLNSLLCCVMAYYSLTLVAAAAPFHDAPNQLMAPSLVQNIVYRKNKSIDQARSQHRSPLYNQNAGYDPAGWLLSGPGLDAAANAMQRSYYESYGFRSLPRNYIYYDWGW